MDQRDKGLDIHIFHFLIMRGMFLRGLRTRSSGLQYKKPLFTPTLSTPFSSNVTTSSRFYSSLFRSSDISTTRCLGNNPTLSRSFRGFRSSTTSQLTQANLSSTLKPNKSFSLRRYTVRIKQERSGLSLMWTAFLDNSQFIAAFVLGSGILIYAIYFKLRNDQKEDDPMAMAVLGFLCDYAEVGSHLELGEETGLPIRGWYTSMKHQPNQGYFWDFTLRIKDDPATGERQQNASVHISYDDNPDGNDVVAMQFCIVDMPHIMKRFVYDFSSNSFIAEPLTGSDTSWVTWWSHQFNADNMKYWLPVITVWPAMYVIWNFRRQYHNWLPRVFRQHLIPENPVIRDFLGEPITIHKNIKGSFSKELANFDLSLTGSKKSANLNIQGRNNDGYWLLSSNLKMTGRKSIPIDFKEEVKKYKN